MFRLMEVRIPTSQQVSSQMRGTKVMIVIRSCVKIFLLLGHKENSKRDGQSVFSRWTRQKLLNENINSFLYLV